MKRIAAIGLVGEVKYFAWKARRRRWGLEGEGGGGDFMRDGVRKQKIVVVLVKKNLMF
jgi:hypothetical protein